MKLEHLSVGARFRFRGRILSKLGPMTASDETGATVFVPKHAELMPLADEPAAAPRSRSSAGALTQSRVLAAFEAYHETALGCVDEHGRLKLEQARARFLASVSQSGDPDRPVRGGLGV